MSWFVPYNQLDNQQLLFLQQYGNEKESNYWLKGYAGSGKSVLLIHCLIKEKERNPNANIIIVLYTHALIDMIRTGLPDKYRHTQVVTYHQFRAMDGHWDLVLVDEVQDLPESTIRNIRSKGKKIIVAGDVNQSIYDDGCTTANIQNLLSARSYNLSIIHRISRRIRQVAQFFCADRNGFVASSIGGMVERIPTLIKAASYAEEIKWLVTCAREYAATGYAPAILIPKHELIFRFLQDVLAHEKKPLMPQDYSVKCRENYDRINEHLKKHGVKFQYLGNGAGSFREASENNLVTIMTYHSAKGLDFRAVFIPFLTPDLQIWRDEDRAKALFFVALTRSREQLYVSYHGSAKHKLLNMVPQTDFNLLYAANEISRMSNPLGDVAGNEPVFVF